MALFPFLIFPPDNLFTSRNLWIRPKTNTLRKCFTIKLSCWVFWIRAPKVYDSFHSFYICSRNSIKLQKISRCFVPIFLCLGTHFVYILFWFFSLPFPCFRLCKDFIIKYSLGTGLSLYGKTNQYFDQFSTIFFLIVNNEQKLLRTNWKSKTS